MAGEVLDVDDFAAIDADPIAPIEVRTQTPADELNIGRPFGPLKFVDVRQLSHAGDDTPQLQGVRPGRRVNQYRPKQALSQQEERWYTVSARVDDPLMVGTNVVVSGGVVQRRIQNRRIDADIAQQASGNRGIMSFAAQGVQFMSDRGIPPVHQGHVCWRSSAPIRINDQP